MLGLINHWLIFIPLILRIHNIWDIMHYNMSFLKEKKQARYLWINQASLPKLNSHTFYCTLWAYCNLDWLWYWSPDANNNMKPTQGRVTLHIMERKWYIRVQLVEYYYYSIFYFNVFTQHTALHCRQLSVSVNKSIRQTSGRHRFPSTQYMLHIPRVRIWYLLYWIEMTELVIK